MVTVGIAAASFATTTPPVGLWHICRRHAPPARYITGTPRGAEIRCYLRDPDEYLIEVGQATGLLHGQPAAKRPEDLPG
jgi:hypothetical protein